MAQGSETPANRSATQTGSTHSKPKAKAKPSTPAGGSSKGKGRYQWATGGRVHSISKKTHEQRVQANQMLGTQDLTAPPSASQAITEANSAADLQFGPQVQAAKQLQANIAPWFGDYLARVAGYAQAAQQLSAPTIGQAQAYQQGAAAQLPPGLDPSSAAGQQAAQAASGRQALAQLGLDALNTNAQATQDYFGGQQTMAARQQPQAQAAANADLAFAQSQRGAKVQEFLTGARQNAQNYQIARGTLNLNSDKAVADAVGDAAALTQAAKDKRAARKVTKRGQDISQQNAADRTEAAGATPNKYGIPASQWEHWSTSHRQRVIDAFNEKSGTGDTKDAAKHAADVQAATGKVQNQVSDIAGFQQGQIGQETDDTTKPKVKDPATGKMVYPPRKVTQADVDKMKIAKYGMLARIAIAIREGRKLDQRAIDYLHNLDANLRIPREWLPPAAKPGYGDKGGGT